MVSIPAWFDWRQGGDAEDLLPVLRFNTSLVRLAPRAALGAKLNDDARFNTSLVRLAPTPGSGGLHPFPMFQYQLGSIGAPVMANGAVGPVTVSIPAWFDWRPCCGRWRARASHQVSIPAWFDWRPAAAWRDGARRLEFQYQLGSIGAGFREKPSDNFTAVSIPAWFDWRARLASRQASDGEVSIPAWFDWRGAVGRSHRGQLPRFNTSLVRLARDPGAADPSLSEAFQYQLGSIGAPVLRTITQWSPSRFNTSLVRLALEWASLLEANLPGFNTSLVRLALQPQVVTQARDVSFNTSLVRLAPQVIRMTRRNASRFQYQLGSIGASGRFSKTS